MVKKTKKNKKKKKEEKKKLSRKEKLYVEKIWKYKRTEKSRKMTEKNDRRK